MPVGSSKGSQSTEEMTGSTLIGLIYVFNLIIGTGALALPKAFQDAGIVLGATVLFVSSVVSYMSASFVIESMSSANAVLSNFCARQEYAEIEIGQPTITEASENSPLLDGNTDAEYLVSGQGHTSTTTSSVGNFSFEIKKRVELSEIASLFLGKYGLLFFQLCLIIYLYGDLAIYSTVVPKSLMSIICTFLSENDSCSFNRSISVDSPCFSRGPAFLTRFTVYRLSVICFAVVVCPFVFVGISKTKYLQIFTTVSRWCAFILLIGLASRILTSKKATGAPVLAKFSGFGELFGITVYSFMCHHSLPSLVTPIRNKRMIHHLFLIVFMLILGFYTTLALTGTFAFKNLEDVYTLNFVPSCLKQKEKRSLPLTIADYFLTLFPVFTLTTNFPIVGITLRNNLRDRHKKHVVIDFIL